MKSKYDIFLSYRREGGYETAKHLYDLLSYDGYCVSFDIDTLKKGDFDKQLLHRIDKCKDFILILDKNAFKRTLDGSCLPQQDWLRCELAHALKQKKNIIPVFLAGTEGFPDNLPIDIAEVTTKNGPKYNREYFDAFYDKLKSDFLESRPSVMKSHFSSKGVIIFFFLLFVSITSLIYINKYIDEKDMFKEAEQHIVKAGQTLNNSKIVIDTLSMEIILKEKNISNAIQSYSEALSILKKQKRNSNIYKTIDSRYAVLNELIDSLQQFNKYTELFNYYISIERLATAEKYRNNQLDIAKYINNKYTTICEPYE